MPFVLARKLSFNIDDNSVLLTLVVVWRHKTFSHIAYLGESGLFGMVWTTTLHHYLSPTIQSRTRVVFQLERDFDRGLYRHIYLARPWHSLARRRASPIPCRNYTVLALEEHTACTPQVYCGCHFPQHEIGLVRLVRLSLGKRRGI